MDTQKLTNAQCEQKAVRLMRSAKDKGIQEIVLKTANAWADRNHGVNLFSWLGQSATNDEKNQIVNELEKAVNSVTDDNPKPNLAFFESNESEEPAAEEQQANPDDVPTPEPEPTDQPTTNEGEKEKGNEPVAFEQPAPEPEQSEPMTAADEKEPSKQETGEERSLLEMAVIELVRVELHDMERRLQSVEEKTHKKPELAPPPPDPEALAKTLFDSSNFKKALKKQIMAVVATLDD